MSHRYQVVSTILMGSRIDLVSIRLYVYDEAVGHKEVEFTVMPQEPFLSAVWVEWRRWVAAQELLRTSDGCPG